VVSTSAIDKDAKQALDIVHSVAQYAHCLAQGKVGSGFDVSSAVYGTHKYRRFSPSILTPLLDSTTSASESLLDHLDPSKWDGHVKPFHLPPGIRLILADVDAGTDTPSFVGKVLEWRKFKRQTADLVWENLKEANLHLGLALEELNEMAKTPYYQYSLIDATYQKIEDVSEFIIGGR
jgi:phosphomevalonate kinase